MIAEEVNKWGEGSTPVMRQGSAGRLWPPHRSSVHLKQALSVFTREHMDKATQNRKEQAAKSVIS